MSLQPAAPGTVYYKRQTFFTVLVYLSILGCIGGMIQSCFIMFATGPMDMFLEFATYLFVLSWDLQILKKKPFFFEGNLTLKCAPWLIVSVSRTLLGVVYLSIGNPHGFHHITYGISFALTFLCYRYWSFFRPYKQVQQMPVYMVQQPPMMATPQMMYQQPQMMHQQQPQMMAQPPMMTPPQFVAPQQYAAQPMYPKN